MADGGVFKEKFLSFLFTSVLAGLVTTSFTYKSWREQTRLDLAKGRLEEATKSFERASQLMSARIFYAYRVLNGAMTDDDAAYTTKLDKLDKAVEEWNIGYPELVQDFQFSLEIDENGRNLPFHDVDTNGFDDKLNCRRPFNGANGPAVVDWKSPTWRLVALNYCFIAANVKSRAMALRQKPPSPTAPGKAASPPPLSPSAPDPRQEQFKTLDHDIDDLKTHGEEVRIAGKKAIARLREATETRGFLEFLKSW